MVKAANFHPMRGDVFEGNAVQFDDGRVLFIRESMSGWTLKDYVGNHVSGPFNGAFDLTAWIVHNQ